LVFDYNLFIAAVKSGWTASTDLIFNLLESSADLFADEILFFEYEKYANVLGAYDLFDLLKKRIIEINPSQDEITICEGYFQDPAKQAADIVHAATCLYTKSILITNDKHFDKIRDAGIIEVWSSTKAIKRILLHEEDYDDPILQPPKRR